MFSFACSSRLKNRGLILLGLLSARLAFAASALVHVPGDQPDLQAAIADVTDGGVIEMAAGTYTAPSGGFTVLDYGKGFTVRAAAGAAVTLTGNNSTDILRIANSIGGAAHTFHFESLKFSSGLSTQSGIGGAMTLVRNDAVFVACTFENNAANGSITGGGGLWLESASTSFEQCTFRGNNSKNYGGAFAAVGSRVFLRNCTFTSNRVNLPNHAGNAPGGAIFDSDSSLSVANCRFEDNHAGYAGGAIYCGGHWKDPVSTPTVDLFVTNTIFTGNSAARDPSVSFPSAPLGGAIHIEDQTTGRFYNCRFIQNFAFQGGAISSYRTITEVTGCVFQGNHADGSQIGESIGGSISALSDDNPDSSTNNGTINRRSTTLTIRDSLFRGDGNSRNALQGGAIFVAGDLNAAYGRAGVTQNGSPESNRAIVTLTRVGFSDLVTTNSGGIPGSAGAIGGAFVKFTMDQSIVENCSTTDLGGAFEFVQGSVATIQNSTIANCKAGSLGGALAIFGGTLDLHDSSLVENRSTRTGQGAAIGSAPSPAGDGLPAMDIDGLVRNCIISNNTGGPSLWEGDGVNTPFNRLQYSSNQLFAATDPPFYSQVSGNQTVQQLNSLTIPRSDGTTSVKSPVANTAPSTPPVIGAILLLPPLALTAGGPGETLPLQPFVIFAASGGRSLLDGNPTVGNAGVAGPTTENAHTLQVGNNTYATTPPQEIAANIATRLPVGTGQNVLIAGFIIQGSGPKRVLIRGVGPSLNGLLSGALQDPILELHNASGALLATNDNWQSTQIGGILTSNQSFDIRGTGIEPTQDAEPAILATLDPGSYTGIVRGVNDTTGIAVVEVYDLDPAPTATLANISTRGFIQSGSGVMIGGFILQGGITPSQIVIRAIGPSLAAFGIANPMSDPTLELHDGNGNTVASNDDWKVSPDAAKLQQLGLQPANDAESAMIQTNLARGQYTAIVRDKTGGTGVGVVEAYIF